MKNRRFCKLLALFMSISIGVGCLTPTPIVRAEEPKEEVTSELPEETATASPSGSPEETGKAEPTESPEETETAEPTESPEEEGTAEPTESPEETATASPSGLPEEITTAVPTESPEETETAEPTPSSVPEAGDLDYILGRPMTEEEVEKQKEAVPAYLPELPKEETVEDYHADFSFYAETPSQYDSRDYGYVATDVRSQSPYGSCWTYASIASLESSLLMQGVEDKDSIDLSEWHLAYFSTHTGSDKLGNTTGDYVKEKSGTRYMDLGGNALMATVALSNWKGAVKESDYPGSSDRETLDAAGEALTPEDAWTGDTYHLQDCYMAPASDRKAVKQLIMANGSVYGSYYHVDSYYNYETAAYYCPESYQNHAITVIGWDDTYSKNNFKVKPEQDGAWLCKNSWGPYFGMSGYFYISYYDVSFNNGNVAAFVGRSIREGENNYYYSGGVHYGTYVYTYGVAQCYEAKANPDGAEVLTGVGFHTLSSGIGYQVQVYRNPVMVDGVVKDPTSGEPVWEEAESGETSFAGYHTIEFSNEVPVEEGDWFSVVISFDKSVELFMDTTFSMSNGYEYVYESVNVANPGESFFKQQYNPYYIDLYESREGSYTPRMNVITENVDKEASINLYQRMADGSNLLLGEYASIESVIRELKAAGSKDNEYVIELTKDIRVRNKLELPDNVGKLMITGPLNSEDQVQLITKSGAEEEIKGYSDLEIRNLSIQGSLYEVPGDTAIIVYGNVSVSGNVTSEDFRIEKGSQCDIRGKLEVNGRTELNGGSEEGEQIRLEAHSIYLNNTDMFYAEIKGYENFQINGTLVSGTPDNKLITYQKLDTAGGVIGVYLCVNKAVVLDDDKNPIEISVLNEQGYPWLKDSPAAAGILVNAGQADAVSFCASEQNCAESRPRLMKKGTGIYVYYSKEAPVEVFLSENGKEQSLANFTDLEQAVKYVDGRKDKSASYMISLYDDIGNEKGMKLNLPTYAGMVTLRSGNADEIIKIRLNNSITLKTDTAFEGIEFEVITSSKTMNISGTKQSLFWSNSEMAEDSRINNVNLAGLSVQEGSTFDIWGKSNIGTLQLGTASALKVMGQNTVITNIRDYIPYEGKGDESTLYVGMNAGVTIKGEVSSQEEGRLLIGKAGARELENLSDIKKENQYLIAENAAASVFAFGNSDAVGVKHAKGIYEGTQENIANGLIQVKLEEKNNSQNYSYYIDWYQAVQEINYLGDPEADYEMSVLSDIVYTKRLDEKGKEIKTPGVFSLPAINKCNSFTVKGNHHKVSFARVDVVNNRTVLEELYLLPQNDKIDLTLKSNKKGEGTLLLKHVQQEESVSTLFRNITGSDKKTMLCLTADTEITAAGNVKGIGTLCIGADEDEQEAGDGRLFVSGTLSAGLLNISSSVPGSLENSAVIVTGQMTVEKLNGQNGVLVIRQTSAKNAAPLGKVTGTSDRSTDAPLTVLVLRPDITSVNLYRQRIAGKDTPFTDRAEGVPLIQAPGLSADIITTAQVEETEAGYAIKQLNDVVRYKDAAGYIYAGKKENFAICIKARKQDGTEFKSYAENWYQAVHDLDKMGNSYPVYELQLLESRVYYTGWDSKKAEEKPDTLRLPSKVKGTLIICNAENVTAELIYKDDMKIPDQLTLEWNNLSFMQVNNKGEQTTRGIRIGNAGTLALKDFGTKQIELGTVTAPRGSLVLENSSIDLAGKADIQNLFVNEGENTVQAKGELNLQNVRGLDQAGKVILETTSRYKGKDAKKQMIQLSQIAVTGEIAGNAEVKLRMVKDTGENYEAEEIMLLTGEKPSLLKRLMKVTGNAADGRIKLIAGDGSNIEENTGHLITQGDGIYLIKESPVIKVTSSGGITDDYIGYFSSWQSALEAVSASVKRDLTLGKDNQKEYQIIFLKEIDQAVGGKIPSNVKKLLVTNSGDSTRMKLVVKGDLSFEGKNGILAFENMDIAVSGKVNGYQLNLTQSGLSAAGDISIKRTELNEGLLEASNVTIGEEAWMNGGVVKAAVNDAANSGRLKVNKLIAAEDQNRENDLIAKVNAKGISQITVDGAVYGGSDSTKGFYIELMQNRQCTIPVLWKEDMLLLTAKKADSSMFRPKEQEHSATTAMLYKKNGGIYYTESGEMGVVLKDETQEENTLFRGSTVLLGIEDAMTEINNRKEKNAVYRIVLLKDQEVRNVKQEYKSLVIPSMAQRIIIEGETGLSRDAKKLSYLGRMEIKGEVVFKNVNLITYKKSGKAYIQEGQALKTGKMSLICEDQVTICGDADIYMLELEEETKLSMKGTLKVNRIDYKKDSSILIEKGNPIALAGNLTAITQDSSFTVILNTRRNINSTQIIKITALFRRPDLQGIMVRNLNSSEKYYIYREGRNVYAGMKL